MSKNKDAEVEEQQVEEPPEETPVEGPEPAVSPLTRDEYDALGKGKDYVPHPVHDGSFFGPTAEEEAPAT